MDSRVHDSATFNDNPRANSASYTDRSDSPLTSTERLSSLLKEKTRLGVARDAKVAGRLIFSEAVRIEGHFRGELTCADLIIVQSTASVEGRINAPRLVILGEVRGSIVDAHQVVIGPLGRFQGELHTNYLAVFEGARIDGYLQVLPNRPQP